MLPRPSESGRVQRHDDAKKSTSNDLAMGPGRRTSLVVACNRATTGSNLQPGSYVGVFCILYWNRHLPAWRQPVTAIYRTCDFLSILPLDLGTIRHKSRVRPLDFFAAPLCLGSTDDSTRDCSTRLRRPPSGAESPTRFANWLSFGTSRCSSKPGNLKRAGECLTL